MTCAESFVLLQPYCDAPVCLVPFAQAGYWYGSDGRIAIRVHAPPGIADDPGMPNMAQLDWDRASDPRTVWYPLPNSIPPETTKRCCLCQGKGKIKIAGDAIPCDGCDGSGRELDDRVPDWTDLTPNIRLKNHYLRLLAGLPQPVEIGTRGKPHEPVAIRFPGGQGLLMPMRKPKED